MPECIDVSRTNRHLQAIGNVQKGLNQWRWLEIDTSSLWLIVVASNNLNYPPNFGGLARGAWTRQDFRLSQTTNQ